MAGRRAALSGLAMATLLALAAPPLSSSAMAADAPPPEGSIAVFSDQMAFAIDAPGPELLAHGYFGGGSLSGLYPAAEPGHVVLVTPPGDALVGRHLDQPIGSLPILTWSWRRLPLDIGWPETLTDDAPMRLIIGFGTPAAAADQSAGRGRLPPCDRALVITWSDHPWESGAADRHGSVGRFIAHGGPADGQWWEESVNLADVHGRLWPDISLGNVRVAWVAVAVRQGSGRSIGEIAGVSLSH